MNSTLRPIKNEDDYTWALETLDQVFDAPEGTPEADMRDILAVLLEKYEDEHHPVNSPSPVEAIKFRMDQLGLSQKDLVPVIGSRSKVSEVLSGKRELSLRMIRALRSHLGIPAEVLIGYGDGPNWESVADIQFEQFPLRDMAKNGAFKGLDVANLRNDAEKCIKFLIEKIGGPTALPAGLFRKSTSSRLNANLSVPALEGWSLQVLAEAAGRPPIKQYDKGYVNDTFLDTLVHLSVLDDGPRLAQELLEKIGISLVVVSHLPKTYLDGAAFMTHDGRPVIGLTLRHDRLDNFWFTLLHEIGHVKLHLSKGSFFADDMSLRGTVTDGAVEAEADHFAESALLPEDFDLRDNQALTGSEIVQYAFDHSIHPAIVAGNIQYYRKDYRSFSQLLGRGKVRVLFGK